MKNFHRNLNIMALFTAIIVGLAIVFYRTFFEIAIANIYLNGIIIGTTLFGIIICFAKIFTLLPEYNWLNGYIRGRRGNPPKLLRAVALMLRGGSKHLSENGLRSILDTVLIRFEDDRESIRYVTNTLVFLGLLGTFWGLILTIGGFAELIRNLNFTDETVLQSMQSGLSSPLGGMATAFTSSLLGLGGSLIVGFLGLHVNLAQNAIFHTVEEFLSARTNVTYNAQESLPKIESNLNKIADSIEKIDSKLEPIENREV